MREPFAPSAGRRDLLVTNARIVDVVLQTVYDGWFTVEGGRFVEVEAGAPTAEDLARLEVAEHLDLGGAWVQPGMIDAHMHIESSLVTPRRFAEAALKRGTTTVLQDPHEVANVLGAPGIDWMVEASRDLPLRVYNAISSCVPATSADIETPNASISAAEVEALAQSADVIALGEVMDFRGLIAGNEHLQGIVAAGSRSGLSLEGHVPSLTGPELSRYVAFGIRSDHTLASPAKLLEELRKGLWVMIQEKSLTPEVVAEIMNLKDRSRVMLITDDVMPDRLLTGHMDRIVRLAIERGWAALDAVAAATLRPATYLGLNDLGLIAPGARADFLVMQDELHYPPAQVFVDGREVVTDGKVAEFNAVTPAGPEGVHARYSLAGLGVDDLRFAAASGGTASTGAAQGAVDARVIRVNQVNSFTTLEERRVEFRHGVPTDPDLALACVIPRTALREGSAAHQPIVCLVGGLGLSSGGFATSFAHDSHNFFLLGRDPAAMHVALTSVIAAGGGMAFAATAQPESVTLLPLPFAGLLSDEPVEVVGEAFRRLEEELRRSGVTVKAPVLLLTLLPLSVSPDFKVTDKGIIDVQARRILTPTVGR